METAPASNRRLPTRAVIGIFAIIFIALIVMYLVMLRPHYIPLFTQMRATDASAIVAQFDAKSIPYRLADNGTTILVPEDQADQSRLTIAGSDIALKGGVGFELFNKSDMGLTDFAQKINYQRALQGELERTILMIEGIETARVHLAMAERSLFRTDRNPAKAAVEIGTGQGHRLDEARVAGLKRLIAFSVPDLSPDDVVILDSDGRMLGTTRGDDTFVSADAEQRMAVERYYRARARAAVEQAMPGLRFDVHVLVTKNDTALDSEDTTARTVPASASGPRDFALRLTVATPVALGAEDAARIRIAIISSAGLDETNGDDVVFNVGMATVSQPDDPDRSSSIAPQRPSAASQIAGKAVERSSGWGYWVLGAGLGASLLVVAWRIRQRRRLSDADRFAFVARVRKSLNQEDDSYAASR